MNIKSFFSKLTATAVIKDIYRCSVLQDTVIFSEVYLTRTKVSLAVYFDYSACIETCWMKVKVNKLYDQLCLDTSARLS